MNKLKVGTILWKMRGTRRNDKIHWYAQPNAIEDANDFCFIFGDGTGGSVSLIGEKYFLTRQEAIDHYLETNKDFTSTIGFVSLPDELKESVYEERRTDWNDYEVVNSPMGNVGVYLGDLDGMLNVTHLITWRRDDEINEFGESYLTLKEIQEQAEKIAFKLNYKRPTITVIQNDPMTAEIWQCNNIEFEKGEWFCKTTCRGYA